MNKNSKLPEKYLCEIWKKQEFSKDIFTTDGQKIVIIEAGQENKEFGGPDFVNARIKIGNITYMGDVEIDSFQSDWKTHGHNLNKRYNKVVLHAVLNNNPKNPFVYTQEGRKINSVSLGSLLDNEVTLSIQQTIMAERKNKISKMPCESINELTNEKLKLDFLYDLGLERFKAKSQKYYERLKEIVYVNQMAVKEPMMQYNLGEDFYNKRFSQEEFSNQELWQQLYYEAIFEALGYSKNKDIMLRFSKIADYKFLSRYADKEDLLMYLESILFNVSGLIPEMATMPDEETAEYSKKITEIWNNVKQHYEGKVFHAAQWHFFKLRPQNFPTTRLAGGARLLHRMLKEDLINNVLNILTESQNFKKIIADIRNLVVVKSDGFWQDHYVFDQPAKTKILYFVGLSRADEIIVNVLLPISAVYFDVFGRKDVVQKIIKVYMNYYQNSENRLVNEVAESLGLHDAWKRSVLAQGMIELFRNYCSKDKCENCSIGKAVFS